MLDLLIIGGGPAGSAGAVYAGRKKLKTAIIAELFEGQSSVSKEIYNWIGTPAISGNDLAQSLQNHVKQYESDDFKIIKDRVVEITKNNEGVFISTCASGDIITSQSVLITSGSSRKKLTIKGADEFEHKGLTYCATCDGPLFSDMDVVVIGGGNAGFESALQLSAYCKTVTLMHRRPEFKADEITQQTVKNTSNITLLGDVTPTEVHGDSFVSGISYSENWSGISQTISCSGIFVEIGSIPNSNFVKTLVHQTESGNIIVDPRTQATSCEGIWAAGDVTDGLYHQNNIAAGDAIKAIENLYGWVKSRK